MITQERFDMAYTRICVLLDQYLEYNRDNWSERLNGIMDGKISTLRQVLAILEDADTP